MKKIKKISLVFLISLYFTVESFLNSNVVLASDSVFTGMSMREILNEFIKGKIDGISQADSLFLVILGWVSFFLPFAGLFAFVGIVYAGFLYLTGFTNEENIPKAKNILMWSVIGLILIFSAYSIVNTFINPTGG